MNAHHPLYHLCLLAALVVGTAACEDNVAAPTGVDEPFSMYGILNPRLNTQTLLVSPTHRLLDDYPVEIDAVVRSTDLETGETVAWRDSVVRGERGQVDHIFVADFRARFGGRYRVEVVRGDAAASSAETSIPDVVDVMSRDVIPNFVDVRVLGENFHLLAADVAYTVRWYDSVGDPDPSVNPCLAPAGTYEFPYQHKIEEIDGGFRFGVNLDFDHERVLGGYLFDFGPIGWVPSRNGLALTGMQIGLLVADPAWAPPGGAFDANVLSQPNVMTNVTNGFGFVGGGYNHDRGIYPGSELVDETWFFDFMLRPPSQCLDFCACGLE